MAEKYKLNREDGEKILKVVIYAGISGAITAFLTILPQIQLPPEYAPIVFPIVNAGLVALKKFFETK